VSGEKPKWFTVALLYESVIEGEPINLDKEYDSSNNVYEESHLLVKAVSSEEAIALGEKIGYENEHHYKNQYDQTVYWKLVKVLDCFELLDEEFKTGTELYSRFVLTPKENSTKDVLKRFFQEE